MIPKNKAAVAAMTLALLAAVGTARAAFEGRGATGAPSSNCTPKGTTTPTVTPKCTYYYDTVLNITILNNWNVAGSGGATWSASAATNSAQARAESAGRAASGLSGWVLPTGNNTAPAGPQNQFKSIWESAGSTTAGLQAQFDGVQTGTQYWSSTLATTTAAWTFNASTGSTGSSSTLTVGRRVVAVRPGDIANVTCGPGVTLTTSPVALWQQLSLPCTPLPSSQTVGAVFGGGTVGKLDSANYGTRWSVWKRNAGNTGNVPMSLAENIDWGAGAWIKSLDVPVGGKLAIDPSQARPDFPVLDTASTACQATRGCILLPVASATEGTRMIANPLPYDIDWSMVRVRVGGASGTAYTPSQAQAADILSNTIWIWNGNTYATWSDTAPTQGQLQYFRSFFVKVLPGGVGQIIELLIPGQPSTVAATTTTAGVAGVAALSDSSASTALPAATIKPRPQPIIAPRGSQSPVTPPSRSSAWVVDLGVLNPNTGWSATAKLGQWPGAQTGFDAGDLVAMSPFGQPYLTLVFPHGDGPTQTGDFTTDLRPANGFASKWDFEVRAAPLNSSVLLRWNAPAVVLAKSRLIDRDTGAVVYPNDPSFAGGYPMTLSTPLRRLTWEYMGN